jgi:hypothetical protein
MRRTRKTPPILFFAALASLLFGVTPAFGSDQTGFWLQFPLGEGKTPDNVEINTVFDRYRPYGNYCADGIVRMMNGMQASNGAGRSSAGIWSSQLRTDCTGPLGDTLYGYTLDTDPGGIRDIVLPRGVYTGGGDKRHLYYDSHPGYDFRAAAGTAVFATAAGVVAHTSAAGGSSCNPLEIDHGNGYKSIYLHLLTRSVSPGARVERGERVGSVGDACAKGAPHLHFELRRGNVPVDPYDPNENGSFDLWTPPNCTTAVAVGAGATNPQRFLDAHGRNGGQPEMGCPTNTVHTWNNGTIQDFAGGGRGTGAIMLANGASTAWAINGPLWSKYITGSTVTDLGYPIGDLSGVATASTGTQLNFQQFENGALEWHRSGSRSGQVFEVHGGIYLKWKALGFTNWWGGMPISDEHDAAASPQGHTGRVSDFERGHIWWRNGGTEAFATHGDIDAVYMARGGPASCLGYPITDEFRNGSGRAQSSFVGGHITTVDGVTYQPVCAASSQTLTVSVTGSGTVTSAPAGISCSAGTCSASFAANASVQLTATPAARWRFGGWTGALSGTAHPQTVAMSGARSVGATFLPNMPAEMTSPAPGSTLSSSTVTFQWSGGAGPSQYWLYVGTTAGANDLYGQNQGTSLSATVAGLPTDRRRLFVRLYSLMGGVWEFSDYTYTATGPVVEPAQMITPAPGSTLNGSTVTFTWNGGTGVTQYWLSVGNSAGGTDLYNRSQSTNLSVTLASLPSDGRRIHVRLWSLIGVSWYPEDYNYTAVTVVKPELAEMTSPAPGSTLQASTVTFQWTGGTGVAQYWLYVGTFAGANDIYGQSRGTSLTATVANLATDGRRLHVRLWSLIGVSWQFNDYIYTSMSNAIPAQMIRPAPQSTLSSSAVAFEWNGGTGVSQYWLQVGTSPGGTNLYSQSRGTLLTATVSSLPTDGRTLYVRLWSLLGVSWQFNDYTYTATTISVEPAKMTSPAPGSTLSATTVTFQWDGGSGVTQYWLGVGTAAGAADLFSQSRGTSLSGTVVGLPADGRKLYVRLWSLIGVSWQFNDYTYSATTTAARGAEMTSPAPGSTLTASTVVFHWAGGTGASQYRLAVGSEPGGSDLFDHDRGTSLSATVAGLPADGRTVHVRLGSLVGGEWRFNDYTYTAATVELTAQACTVEGTLRSVEGVELAPIRFVNASGQERRIFWLDYAGARVQYHTLQPGEWYVQGSYLTHPWLVSDATDGCRGIYLPVRGGARVTLR